MVFVIDQLGSSLGKPKAKGLLYSYASEYVFTIEC